MPKNKKVIVDACYLKELEANHGCSIKFFSEDNDIEFLGCAPKLNIKSDVDTCGIKVVGGNRNQIVQIKNNCK